MKSKGTIEILKPMGIQWGVQEGGAPLAGVLLDEMCILTLTKVVDWIEFKPSRGMRSTELNRSSRSSNDLKSKIRSKQCGRPEG